MSESSPKQVIEFWRSIGPKSWFGKSAEIDNEIKTRFADLHASAARGELSDWRSSPESCLALVLVLDQFSRNMFREDGRAFAQDPPALAAAEEAVANGYDREVENDLAMFFHMPFMHSESIAVQEKCVALMQRSGKPDNLRYACIHRDVIRRFGRFPHRNAILGRHTTPAEQRFLESGGFSG